MKLLLDQNLSAKLCARLDPLYPGTTHVRLLGLDQSTDAALWEHAQLHGLTIVTLDRDFFDLSALHGWPPKVIWLRYGNQPTRMIEHLLRSAHAAILQFENDSSAGVLELS
jgi:predicted nuclease of predicted toxin-antitoxin system